MADPGIKETVEIPEEADVGLENDVFKVSGPEGELSREFDLRGVELVREGNKVIVSSDSSRKKRRSAVGTVISRINNMFEGVVNPFSSELKVVYSHFPISVSVEGDKVKIENFIGEETPRVAEIVGKNTKVDVKGEDIELSGPDKEAVGQTAANIEQATQAKGRDPRVFQDGIYIVEGP